MSNLNQSVIGLIIKYRANNQSPTRATTNGVEYSVVNEKENTIRAIIDKTTRYLPTVLLNTYQVYKFII